MRARSLPKLLALCGLLAAAAGGPGCRGRGDGGNASKARVDAGAQRLSALSILVAEQLDAELHFSPTLATWLGDHSSDDRLDDVRIEAVLREVARLGTVQERLRRLTEGSEADPQRPEHLIGALMQARIEAKRFELAELRPHERNPIFYVQLVAQGLDGLIGPGLLTAAGLRSLKGRLSAVPGVLREAQRTLKNPPEVWTRHAIEMAGMTRDFVAVLLPRILASLAAPDPKLLDELSQQREQAQRALEEFTAWLSRDLLPRSKGDFAQPRGRLLNRLRLLEHLDVSIETVQEVAEFEQRETRRRFEELARRIAGVSNPGRAVAEALRAIEDDHPKPEELLRAAEQAVAQAYELTESRHYLTPPSQRPRVAELPAYRFGGLLLSVPAPLEPDREPQLLVDPVDPSWKDKKRVTDHLRLLNRSQLLLAAVREVVPGRMALVLQARAKSGEQGALRQRTYSAAFVEGWASYAEQLMALEGPGLGASVGNVVSSGGTTEGEEERARRVELLALRYQLVALGRLVVLLRLHAPAPLTASPAARLDEAARYLTEECYLDETAAKREADRATYDPLYGLAALGRLQLVALRADARAEQGERFSLQAFHDDILAQGVLPIPLLRRLLLKTPGPSLRAPPEPAPQSPQSPDSPPPERAPSE